MTDMRKIINLLDYREKLTIVESDNPFTSFKSWANSGRKSTEGMDEPLEEEANVEIFTGPAYWASYLVNGDSSGLEPYEVLEADKWKEGILPYHVQDVKRDENGEPEDPHYSIHFDLHSGTDFTGGNVVDYVCRKHEHEIDESIADDVDFELSDDDDDDYLEYGEEEFPDDPDEVAFADPGGHSALRAASRSNPRTCPCPTCGHPNRLTAADVNRGYQCDRCADAMERGGEIDYYEGDDLEEWKIFKETFIMSDIEPRPTLKELAADVKKAKAAYGTWQQSNPDLRIKENRETHKTLVNNAYRAVNALNDYILAETGVNSFEFSDLTRSFGYVGNPDE